MLLSSGSVLLHDRSVLTPDERTSLLHSSLAQILPVSVPTQRVLDRLDRMPAPLHLGLAQRFRRAPPPLCFPDGHDDTFAGWSSINADGLVVDESVVLEGVESHDVVGFLGQGEAVALLQEAR